MIGACCRDAFVEHEKLRISQFRPASSDNGWTSLSRFFFTQAVQTVYIQYKQRLQQQPQQQSQGLMNVGSVFNELCDDFSIPLFPIMFIIFGIVREPRTP